MSSYSWRSNNKGLHCHWRSKIFLAGEQCLREEKDTIEYEIVFRQGFLCYNPRGIGPLHVTVSWGQAHVTSDHMLFQDSAGYREVRDLNFSDHVKHKKALKLYIILILKTSALRFFL